MGEPEKQVRKAVIAAAGWGTRLLPLSKTVAKEMLPLVDKPVIQYAVEEAVASGIEQVIVVTSPGKQVMEDYFDRAFELERFLEERGNTQLLEEMKHLASLADIWYVRQHEQKGLGHAVLVARELLEDEPFALILPDDVIESPVPALKQMLEVYERHQGSVLALQRVAAEEVGRYGIITPRRLEERVYQVLDMVEKPEPGEAASDLAIIGRYILTPEIFRALEATPPGRNQEVQLTDGLRLLLKEQAIYGYEYEGTRHDAGTTLGLLKATAALALHHPRFGGELRGYLRGLLEQG